MPNEPVKITAQELEEIKKLPSCQFMLGGTPQTGFFDKVNEKIYYLDSEGNWMVKRARVKKREPEKPQEEEAPAEENGEEEESGKRRWLRRKAKSDVEDESEDGRSRLDALKESLEQPLFEKIPLTRKKLLVIIGGIVSSVAASKKQPGNINVLAYIKMYDLPVLVNNMPAKFLGSEPPRGSTVRLKVLNYLDNGMILCRCIGTQGPMNFPNA